MKKHFKSRKDYQEARRQYFRKHSDKVNKIELRNQLVDDVFNHPNSSYSLFVYELIKRIIFTGDPLEIVSKDVSKRIKEIK